MTIDKLKCIDPNDWCISDEVLYGPQLSHFFLISWDLNKGLPVEKPELYPLLYEIMLWLNKILLRDNHLSVYLVLGKFNFLQIRDSGITDSVCNVVFSSPPEIRNNEIQTLRFVQFVLI